MFAGPCLLIASSVMTEKLFLTLSSCLVSVLLPHFCCDRRGKFAHTIEPTVNLLARNSAMVRVIVKWGKSGPYEVELTPSEPVANFKQLLYELTGAILQVQPCTFSNGGRLIAVRRR